jgi:hypothetical protein
MWFSNEKTEDDERSTTSFIEYFKILCLIFGCVLFLWTNNIWFFEDLVYVAIERIGRKQFWRWTDLSSITWKLIDLFLLILYRMLHQT